MTADVRPRVPRRIVDIIVKAGIKPNFWSPQSELLATAAIFTTAFGVVIWLWLFSDSSWFHIELFSISEHVWTGPQATSLTKQLGSIFNWHVFDISPYRLRALSDFAEILDALSRPIMKGLVGLHPSVTLLGLAIAVATAAFFYLVLRRLDVPSVHAAFFVLLLVTTVGFLSCFIPYIRPAKKLAILFCCIVPYLCLVLQQERNRTLYSVLIGVLFLGFFADETGYTLLPIALVFMGPALVRGRRWAELIGFLCLLIMFFVTARLVLPWVYDVFGTSGARSEAVAGQIVFRLLGYLFKPSFYPIAFNDWGTSVLISFGLADASHVLLWVFGASFFGATGLAVYLLQRSKNSRYIDLSWNLVASALSLIGLSFSLTLFDWFNNPLESNYLGALTYYYHSSMAVMAVLWLACLLRAMQVQSVFSVSRMTGPIVMCAIGLVSIINVHHFKDINRFFQILHTYPLDAPSLIGGPYRSLESLSVDRGSRNATIHVKMQPKLLDDEIKKVVHRLLGPRESTFIHGMDVVRRSPMGGSEYVRRYIGLFYPGYNIHVAVDRN